MTITYLVDGYYNPADELGVAWDDPEIGADWGDRRPDRVGPRPGEPQALGHPAPPGAPGTAAHLIRRRVRPTIGHGAGHEEIHTHEAARHRRRRVHRLQLRALAARQPRRLASSPTTPSPTPATSTTCATSEDDPRFAFVKGDIRDREAVRAAMVGCDGVRALRGREPRRPLDHRPRRVRADQLPGHQRRLRRGPPGRSRPRAAHLHRRGLRLGRGGLLARRPTRLLPRSPYSASKAGSDLIALSYVTTYGLPVVVDPGVEQLRALPVPREGHPAVRHEPARRAAGAALRRRPQRAGLALRRGPLRRRRRGLPPGRGRARSTTSAAATRCPTGS